MKEIVCSGGECVQVDDIDWLSLSPYSWSIGNSGYAHATIGGVGCLLHELVAKRAGMNMDAIVDHKDRNRLNCQRTNLRPATQRQQKMNVGVRCDNRCGYKGVRKISTNSYRARAMSADSHRVTLGPFKTPEEAAQAYDDFVESEYGEFAVLNFPRE